MKIAYVQDWLTVDGGAEKVTREILSLFPEAEVFSLIDFMAPDVRQEVLLGKKAKTSFLQFMPMAKKHYRWYLPLFPYAIESLNLSAYDLIISSSYAVAKGVRTRPGQKHICYCHSPMRYAWDLQKEYLDDLAGKSALLRSVMRFFLNRIKKWDAETSNRVDCFVANSNNVKTRISKSYNRESRVIYPPINLDIIELISEKEDYFLASSRQVPYKKTDLIIKAFLKMPTKKLIVTGDGPMMQALKKLAAEAENIEILGHVSAVKLRSLMGRAKAFINASYEDFGISPIEALASGTPVIGFAKGGLLETTTEKKTAVYFNEQNVQAICDSVHVFEKTTLDKAENLRKSVEIFDQEHFRTHFKEAVSQCLAD